MRLTAFTSGLSGADSRARFQQEAATMFVGSKMIVWVRILTVGSASLHCNSNHKEQEMNGPEVFYLQLQQTEPVLDFLFDGNESSLSFTLWFWSPPPPEGNICLQLLNASLCSPAALSRSGPQTSRIELQNYKTTKLQNYEIKLCKDP